MSDLLTPPDRRRGIEEAALTLIKAGADIEAEDTSGNTPLILAAKRGYLQVVDALIKSFQQIFQQMQSQLTSSSPAIQRHLEHERSRFVNARSHDGTTPLKAVLKHNSSYCRREEHQQIIQLLLSAGAHTRIYSA